jgi:hypothetical protein
VVVHTEAASVLKLTKPEPFRRSAERDLDVAKPRGGSIAAGPPGTVKEA